MDYEVRNTRFRGGRISLFILAISFFAIFIVRILPNFVEVTPWSNKIPPDVISKLGCVDYELSQIDLILQYEIDSLDFPQSEAIAYAQRSYLNGLEVADRLEILSGCMDYILDHSPVLYTEGEMGAKGDLIDTYVMDIYITKAELSMAIIDSRSESVERMKEQIKAVSNRYSIVNDDVSSWIGRKISSQI